MHHFGGNQTRAQAGLGQATGMGNDRAGQLLKILAPIVMAYLAKRMFAQRADGATAPAASNAQALGDVLGQEQQHVAQQGGLGDGLLGAVFDQDSDGQLGLGDLLKLGGGMLGGRR